MSVRANFADIYLRGMRDRSMRSETELAREIQLTDNVIGQQQENKVNLSNRFSGVRIPRDICTRLALFVLVWRYLYSTKCSWIVKPDTSS